MSDLEKSGGPIEQQISDPNHHHKPYLSKTMGKTTSIGLEYHQAQVPDYSNNASSFKVQSVQSSIFHTCLSKPQFLHRKVIQSQLDEYLRFVEDYFEQKTPDFFTISMIYYTLMTSYMNIIRVSLRLCEQFYDTIHSSLQLQLIVDCVSRQRTRTKALQFLHSMNYNYTHAKFYILFPYYLHYNNYRRDQPLNITDQDMLNKIKSHQQILKNTKEKDLQKWIATVETSIESRIHLTKLNTLIQNAKQNKYEIPDFIKDQIQKSIKIGKQLKKTLQNNKMSLQKLQLRRLQLQDYKIVTNQMIQFDEAVNRCQQWVRKQQKFEQIYYKYDQDGNYNLSLPNQNQKIQFRLIQLLMNEYNNLPLIYDNFDKTTGLLYNNTIILLQKLPILNKNTKTRTSIQSNSNIIKLSYQKVNFLLYQIKNNIIENQQFINFQIIINQSLELIQRISMFLQDYRCDKTYKILNNYLKLINDIPIQNKVQKKLQLSLEYYQLMQKVKKDIMNPIKYEQIKQSIKKLKQKSFESPQYSKLQIKLITYIGWYQSQQILKQQYLKPTLIEIIICKIKQKMINYQEFKIQLIFVNNQLNISQQILQQYQNKLKLVQQNKQNIINLLQSNQPCIKNCIELFYKCIQQKFYFKQLEQLQFRIIHYLKILSKIQYLLFTNSVINQNNLCFLDSYQCQSIIDYLYYKKQDIKQLQTKQFGNEILQQVKLQPFQYNLWQWIQFEKFIQKGQEWSKQALIIIEQFKNTGNTSNVKELIQQSKHCLHSKNIKEEINRIDLSLKWRQKINRKMHNNQNNPFTNEDKQFLTKVVNDLTLFQFQNNNNNNNQNNMKQEALNYLNNNYNSITNFLKKISQISIDNLHKLSQINKFLKEIDKQIEKYQLQDKILNQMKNQLHLALLLNQDWKDKYSIVRKFQRKKNYNNKKIQQDFKQIDMQLQLKNNQQQVYKPMLIPRQKFKIQQCKIMIQQGHKNKYTILNKQFGWYFKLFLLIIQFYNGYQLIFFTEQLLKLKQMLTDLYKFIEHYNQFMTKNIKKDYQLNALQSQCSKFAIFCREILVIEKKSMYINAWKQLAQPIIRSVPILNMQLKARKPPELLEIISARKKNEQISKAIIEQKIQQSTKRIRKANPLYNSDDITLITDETFGCKTKKKKKGFNNDTDYRTTAVASSNKRQVKNEKEENQRIQAILNNGELSADMIYIDDPNEYCICRYGVLNENSAMIQCESRCSQWYHIECIGIKKHQLRNHSKYICVGCQSLYFDEIGEFFWNNHTKISEYALAQVVQQGNHLGVQCLEIKKMSIISEKIMKWKNSVKQLLQKMCTHNMLNLQSYEDKIYELYLQSLWLPTFHTQTPILKKLLMNARTYSKYQAYQ